MAQFKRFNTSENDNYNSSDAYPEGTLTWDPSNGLRIHDGNTGGGNAVGGNTGYTRFLNRGIGSYDNGSSYDMTIAPNWDGEFPGHVSINLPSNENFGSPLQIVHNSTGGIQLITQNDAAWSFGADGNLTLPVNGDIKDRDGNSVLGSKAGGINPTETVVVLDNIKIRYYDGGQYTYPQISTDAGSITVRTSIDFTDKTVSASWSSLVGSGVENIQEKTFSLFDATANKAYRITLMILDGETVPPGRLANTKQLILIERIA